MGDIEIHKHIRKKTSKQGKSSSRTYHYSIKKRFSSELYFPYYFIGKYTKISFIMMFKNISILTSIYICDSKFDTGLYSKFCKSGHFDAAGWVQGTFSEKKGMDEPCKLI